MRQDEVIEVVGRAAEQSGLFDGLFLGGSFGKGTADIWSDIDLIGLADAEHHGAITKWWRAWLEAQEPVIYFKVLPRGGVLINAITESWLRLDLYLPADGQLGDRPQNAIKPLFDPQHRYDALIPSLPDHRPDPKRIEEMVWEFLRILGLTPLGLGRQEYVTMVMGTGLLRDMLSQLMQEELPIPDRGGILHLNSLLQADDLAILEALPYPGPNADALVTAQLALANAFLPRAFRLATSLGVDWPAGFEESVRAHLARAVGRAPETLWPLQMNAR